MKKLFLFFFLIIPFIAAKGQDKDSTAIDKKNKFYAIGRYGFGFVASDFESLSHNIQFSNYFSVKNSYEFMYKISSWYHLGGDFVPYEFSWISIAEDTLSQFAIGGNYAKERYALIDGSVNLTNRITLTSLKNNGYSLPGWYLDFGAGASIPYYLRHTTVSFINNTKIKTHTSKLGTQPAFNVFGRIGFAFISVKGNYRINDLIKNPLYPNPPKFTLSLEIGFPTVTVRSPQPINENIWVNL